MIAPMSPSLQQLRHRIARLEGVAPATMAGVFSTGHARLDAALPWPGLPRGAVHEILCPDLADGAATGFALGLLASAMAAAAEKFVLWARGPGDFFAPLFAPGLCATGIDPGRMIFAAAAGHAALLAALEEGLRCAGLAAAVGEAGALDFNASRRLQLAAASSGVALLLLRPERFAATASAAVSRWHVASRPGGGARIALLRCRGGQAGHWDLP